MDIPSYDLCEMRKGGFRADCLVTYDHGRMCGWFNESYDQVYLGDLLRQHMKDTHRTRITLPKEA